MICKANVINDGKFHVLHKLQAKQGNNARGKHVLDASIYSFVFEMLPFLP